MRKEKEVLDEETISLIEQQGAERFNRCFKPCGILLIVFESFMILNQLLVQRHYPNKPVYLAAYSTLLLTCILIFVALNHSKKQSQKKRVQIIRICEIVFMVIVELWAITITVLDSITNNVMDLLVYISVLTLLPSIIFIRPVIGISIQVVLDLLVYAGIFILDYDRLGYLIVNFTTFAYIAIIIYSLTYRIQKDLYKREAQLKKASENDHLTGLLNRFSYSTYLEMLKSHPENRQFAILLLDLNGLKTTNDTLGHSTGDDLIKGAAWCIYKAFHKNGVCFRTGGDEFVVILNKRLTEIPPMIQDFQSLCRKWKGELISSPSVSYGLAEALEEPELNVDQLVELADRRMYKMKEEYYKRAGIDRRK